jgi:hypothetical protein
VEVNIEYYCADLVIFQMCLATCLFPPYQLFTCRGVEVNILYCCEDFVIFQTFLATQLSLPYYSTVPVQRSGGKYLVLL